MLGECDVAPTIAVRNLARARKFYEDTLGARLNTNNTNTKREVLYKTGDTVFSIYESEMAGTNHATYASWEVHDIEDVVEGLQGRGVTFEHYDFPGTSREGDIHVMGDEKAAWFKDPDGNILCVHEEV